MVEFSYKTTISKLNFNNIEIQVKEEIDKSILNVHLDEILYFFEETKYDVVIIEDLDRFGQTEIFTKLREINLLINNSRSISRDVTFIYAIRDEMFKNKERTKFFDFIIPVIPVINYSNSNEQLTTALKKFNYSVSTELIDNVAFYIDDMRLLYNIINEFHIYYQKFRISRFQDKLFSIIVYKNIYPEDFSLLGRNEGVLFKFLETERASWIMDSVSGINKQIETLEKEYSELEHILPKKLEELKRLYLFEYLKRIPNLSYFIISNSRKDLQEIFEDENFEGLMKNTSKYEIITPNRRIEKHQFNFTFNEIEKVIDPENSYMDRKVKIENYSSGRLNTIQNLLEDLKQRKRGIQSIKTEKLLKDKNIKLPEKPNKHEQLIILLLRNGYIAEDYLYYISYFYPGTISESDHWFLMNVRNEIETKPDYKLSQTKNIIKKLNDSDFEKPFILNFRIVDFLTEKNSDYGSKKDILFKQLANESSQSIDFIKGYIAVGAGLDQFIIELCSKWTNIWGFIKNSSSFTEVEISHVQELILNHANLQDIKKFSAFLEFKSDLMEKTNILTSFKKFERLRKVVLSFDLKFSNLNFIGVSDEVKEFIYQNNYYKINIHMLKLIIQTFGRHEEAKFNSSNYTAIQDSECKNLIEYVNHKIEDYIDQVFLKIENNYQESLACMLQLLNNPDISIQRKEQLIIKTETKIDSFLNLANPKRLVDILLKNSKIESKWANIKWVYEEEGNTFSQTLNDFLNIEQNCIQLSNEKLTSKNEGFKEFGIAFFLNDKIENNKYQNYLKAISYSFTDLNFETLSKIKVQSLVEKQKIAFSVKNYTKLHTGFSKLHLDFSVNNITSFFAHYTKISGTFSEEDLMGLLSHQKLAKTNKIKLIEIFDVDNSINKAKTLTQIGLLFKENYSLKLSIGTLKNILTTSNLTRLQKIELYMRAPNKFNDEFLRDFLIQLGAKFSRLVEKGPMPNFDNNPILVSFFQHLQSKGKISKIKIIGDKIKVTTFRN